MRGRESNGELKEWGVEDGTAEVDLSVSGQPCE